MIVVTWVVPAILFFVSIFGWEHFVGKRDLLPGECMVQFLKDPVFNTSLIVGYYWIPLTILIILYSFIFHSAWTLSKKAADKERERQKLLAALAKKPGVGAGTGTPPTISKKATNTALGIAAVAMTSSFAPSNQNGSSASNKVEAAAAAASATVEAKKDDMKCTCVVEEKVGEVIPLGKLFRNSTGSALCSRTRFFIEFSQTFLSQMEAFKQKISFIILKDKCLIFIFLNYNFC